MLRTRPPAGRDDRIDRHQALTKRRDRLFAVLDRIWIKNSNVPAHDARHDTAQPVKHLRCLSPFLTRLRNIPEAIELYLEPVEDDMALSPNAKQIELAV